MVEAVKDPAKVRAGKAGSASRWGPKRIVRLSEVDPTVAAAIRALVEADRRAKEVRDSPEAA